MGDLSNPDYNIFPTPDSMGFQIVYEAEFPFTSLDPENLKIDFPGGYMETVIPATEMPGIDANSLDLPEIPPIEVIIPVVDTTGGIAYLDTALTIYPTGVDPYSGEIIYDTLEVEFDGTTYTGTPFFFPIDSARTLHADFYNAVIAYPVNEAIQTIFGEINNADPIDFGLNALIPDSEPRLISSIDTINIKDGDNSVYATTIKNYGIPTSLSSVYSRLITGTDALDDNYWDRVK